MRVLVGLILLAFFVVVVGKGCGRLLGISRRFSIPLLERLDAERFTRRAGDRRHVAPPTGAVGAVETKAADPG